VIVAPIERLIRLLSRLHLPRRTVRLRLTLIYGAMFLTAGVALLAITYGLVHHYTGSIRAIHVKSNYFRIARDVPPPYLQGTPRPGPNGEVQINIPRRSQGGPVTVILPPLQALLDQQRSIVLGQLLVDGGIALGVMAVLSIGLGWLVAGRVLRPLRTITGTVRTISAENLRERLAVGGPADEIKELGDTFDGLLGRLDASFEAQRQFVANASHELRTPLARQRTLAEVALRDSEPTIESLRKAHERVLASGEQQERLIEALLTLARSERGLDRREPFDLAALTGEVLAAHRSEAERRGLHVDVSLEPVTISGDPSLVERMVANLVDNALEHNVADGMVQVATAMREGSAVLSVANSGQVIPPEGLDRLFRPFQRLAADRTSHGNDSGLGLSIVRAVADAHDAEVTARARPDGGLTVEVTFGLDGAEA
jgi:signal transduction histidine kinase